MDILALELLESSPSLFPMFIDPQVQEFELDILTVHWSLHFEQFLACCSDMFATKRTFFNEKWEIPLSVHGGVMRVVRENTCLEK